MQLRFSFALFYVGELYDSTQYPQNGSPPHNIITNRICQKGHQIQKITISSLQCNGGSFAVRLAITLQRIALLRVLRRDERHLRIASLFRCDLESKKNDTRNHLTLTSVFFLTTTP